jgi:hypothetical protein
MGEWPYIDISLDEFNRIKIAKDNLFTILGVEEKFDMLLQNYAEYEQALLTLAVGQTIGARLDRDAFSEATFLVNRRLANLLTLCRQYIDQIKHDFSGIYASDPNIEMKVNASFSRQYDSLFGYRVMEAIRNYTQHRAFPVTRLSYPAAWEERKTGDLLHFRVQAELDVNKIVRDGSCKARVAQELKNLNQPFMDITGLARQYVQGLGCVHGELRELVASDLDKWEATFLEPLNQYAEQIKETPTSIVAYRLTEAETVEEEFDIFRDGADRLRRLRQRTLPSRLADWFVSNELVSRANPGIAALTVPGDS